MADLVNQAVAGLFFVFILLLACSAVLAPSWILWLSAQRLYPQFFPAPAWQMTGYSTLLALVPFWLWPGSPDTGILSQLTLCFLLILGCSCLLLPLIACYRYWKQ